jgi:lipopolysaccharide assembly outer membrane protein LptD (OstA)
MAQIDIKQIRGASQGSILFLGTNSTLSEDYNNLNWNQSDNILYINGNIQIVDGNQQEGYVLTSDDTGLATWTQSLSADNGLNIDNKNIVLGGTLSKNTTIEGASFSLNLNNLDNFVVTSESTFEGEVFIKIERWTFDFMEALNTTIYADNNYSIDEVTNVVGTPIITIEVNNLPYTLGDSISLGDKIYIESDINSVVKLKIVK